MDITFVVAIVLALAVIWISCSFSGAYTNNISIDPETINVLQPIQNYKRKEKSPHDIKLEEAIAYHRDNNNPFPGLDDMNAFLEAANIVTWERRQSRLGESDSNGPIYWDGQS